MWSSELGVQIRVCVCHNGVTVELEMLIVESVVRVVPAMEVQDQVEVIQTHTMEREHTMMVNILFYELFHVHSFSHAVAVGYTACGTLHSRFDMVAALNAPQFDPHTPNGNPNKNNRCNKRMRVQGPSGSVDVAIVDRCPVCKTVCVEQRMTVSV